MLKSVLAVVYGKALGSMVAELRHLVVLVAGLKRLARVAVERSSLVDLCVFIGGVEKVLNG